MRSTMIQAAGLKGRSKGSSSVETEAAQTKPPVAIGYARISTDDQKKGHGKERQFDKIKAWASRNGWALDPSNLLIDEGVSSLNGDNATSGKLASILRAAEAGDIPRGSVLIVENGDRLSRAGVSQSAALRHRILKAGLSLAIVDDGTVTEPDSLWDRRLRNAPAELLQAVKDFLASDESMKKADRVGKARERARRAAVENRTPFTSLTPAWIRLVRPQGSRPSEGHYEIIPERAEIVRHIFGQAVIGVGEEAIAQQLNAGAGEFARYASAETEPRVPTFGHGKKKAAFWHKSYIAKILRNKAVIGTCTLHKVDRIKVPGRDKTTAVRTPLETVEGHFPAIVPEEVFYAVQKLKGSRAEPQRGASVVATRNLFGGILRCSECGAAVTLVYKGKNNGVRRLVCTRAKLKAGCAYRSVPYADVEAGFLEQASGILGHPPAGESAGGPSLDASIEQSQERLAIVSRSLANLMKNAELAPSPALAARIRELDHEKRELEKSVRDMEQTRDTVTLAAAERDAGALRKLLELEPLDRVAANALIRQLFAAGVVNISEQRMDLHWMHGGTSIVPFGPRAFGFQEEGPGKRTVLSSAEGASVEAADEALSRKLFPQDFPDEGAASVTAARRAQRRPRG